MSGAGAKRPGDEVARSHPAVRFEVADRIATVTIDRPEVRNALNTEVLRLLPHHVEEAEGRDDVDVIILTGTDPAFTAGVDLKEAAAGGHGDTAAAIAEVLRPRRGPLPAVSKPLIGAVNGVAVTGGLELALACDFLVASDRARFADTHARVGVMPGWGLTVLLPQAIGVRRAREMSTTGNYVDADLAYAWGLVNHVVPHDELLGFCRALAADIISNDQAGVRQILATYREVTDTTVAEGWQIEARRAAAWPGNRWDPDEIAKRREHIVARGRAQQG
jgi:enoyl-CoA hydratase/carnithine racemase